MLFAKTVIYCAFALANIASAAPSVKFRADSSIEVFANENSTVIIPAISASAVTAGLSAMKPKRQATFAVDQVVLSIVDKITSIIQGMIDSDVNRRMYFTQQVVGTAAIQFPGKNIVMSNVGCNFAGTALTIQKAVYNAKVGSDVTYDVLVFEAGNTFTLQGDGGFQNWCCIIQDSCTVSGGGSILSC